MGEQPLIFKIDINTIIAWIGCITGIVALGWNIFTWLRSGPRIVFKVRRHTVYKDSKIKQQYTDKDGSEVKIPETYCHLEVINRGDIATTLLNIRAEGSMDIGKTFIDNSRFEPHFGDKLPHVLNPGSVWSCRFEESLLNFLCQKKQQCFFILEASCRDKPYKMKIKIGKGEL